MPGTNPFTEEGRTRFKNFRKRVVSLLLLWLFLGLLAAGGYVWYKATRGLRPLQSLYFRQYLRSIFRSSLPVAKKPTKYTLLVRLATNPATGKDAVLGVNDDQVALVLDASGKWIASRETGPSFSLDPKLAAKKLYWTAILAGDDEMNRWLRQNIFGGAGLLGLFYPGLVIGAGLFGAGGTLSVAADRRFNRRLAEGELVRGTRKLTPKEFARELRGVEIGIAIPASVPVAGRTRAEQERRDRRMGKRDPTHPLGVPRVEEAEHFVLLGDSGTGKSQLMHHMLTQIDARRLGPNARREAAIIYDPAGEFVRRFYRPECGDVILSPLDARCPYWSPVAEIRLITDRTMIAESFFPGHHDGFNATAKFFTGAGRDIFGRMLEFDPTPEQIVETLKSAEAIDRLVDGTEYAHYVDHKAGNQRGGVLATLAECARALKLLPRRDEVEGGRQIVLTEWARTRRGWIFITSTKDTRDALRPLHAALIDILMKRLMSVSPEWGREHPCWLFVDEVHALKRLPALADALAEGRKYGIKIVMGTQSKSDFEEHYGKGAPKMLAIPHTKFYFRTNEPESAKWVADAIGEAERERTKIGTTASVEDKGRDAINYSTENLRRATVSKEEVMALPNMQAYLKYADAVVEFRFEHSTGPAVADEFWPRKGSGAKATAAAAEGEMTKDAEDGSATDTQSKYCGGVASAPDAGRGLRGGGGGGPQESLTDAAESASEEATDEARGERRKVIDAARAAMMMLDNAGDGPSMEHTSWSGKVIPIGRVKSGASVHTGGQSRLPTIPPLGDAAAGDEVKGGSDEGDDGKEPKKAGAAKTVRGIHAREEAEASEVETPPATVIDTAPPPLPPAAHEIGRDLAVGIGQETGHGNEFWN